MINIDGVEITEDNPAYFIAEIGSNFDGSLDRAKALIELAVESGAHAVKFQHYTANTLVSHEAFVKLGASISHQKSWKQSVFDTYAEASLQKEWTGALFDFCKRQQVTFFTSPYSHELADFVEPFVAAYKIGSGDISYLDLIEHIADKGKPVLLATGASDLKDVDRAVQTLSSRNSNFVLMQCNTNYESQPENFSHLNLRVLENFRARYPSAVLGFSDHTKGHSAVLGSIALGARVIEKHFTDDTSRPGPDHGFAMDPNAWKQMMSAAAELQAALGDGVKRIEANETQTVKVQRRGVVAATDLNIGHSLSKKDFRYLRPLHGTGYHPYEHELLIGRKLSAPIKKGEPILNEHF